MAAARFISTLTIGTDTGVPFTGGNFNDTFVAGLGGLNADARTLNSLDVLDGGAGVDTLRVEGTGGVNRLGDGASIKNIENLVFIGGAEGNAATSINGGATIDASTFSRALTFQQTTNTANPIVLDKVAGQVLTLDRVADGVALSATYVAAQASASLKASGVVGDARFDVKGAGTALVDATLVVDTTATGKAVTVEDVNGTADTVKNVTVDASGASTVVVNSTALDKLVVKGDGAVSLTTGTAAATSVDASASKGGVTLNTALLNGALFTGGAGKDTITLGANTKAITTGAGDDTVNVTASALGVGGSIDAGAGIDTVSMSAADAATASGSAAFANSISNFEVLKIGQVAGGGTVTINMSNMDNLATVSSAGTAAATGVAEIQTYTVTAGADANGGNIVFGGVDISIANNATPAQVATAIAAQQAAIIAQNPLVASVAANGAQVVVTYNQFAADQAEFANVVAGGAGQAGSGVTFGGVAETNGTNQVNEVQTLTVGTAPTAGGVATVNVNGTLVGVNLLAGQTTAQAAAAIQAAITAANVPNVTATVATNVVTLSFTAAAADAAEVTFNAAATGAAATAATPTAWVAGAAETQTFTVTAGTDANGGSVVVGGVRVDLAGNLSVDQVGTAIASASAAIIAANPTIASVNYNTGNDTVTVVYTAAAGNVAPITVADNNNSAVAISAAQTVAGVVGTAGGILNITNAVTGGTFELTGTIGGATSIAVKDAATNANDVFNVKLNGTANLVNTAALSINSVETINIATASTGTAPVTAASTLTLFADAAKSITVSGNHGVNFGLSNVANVTSLDASGVTGTGNAGSVTFSSSITNQNVSIKGGAGNDVLSANSLTDATKVATIDGGAGNDTIIGSAGKDVLSGGADNDTITGGAGADTISLGAGNDKIVINAIADSVLASRDVISDFSANTFGNGTGGAAGTGAGASANWTGDVVSINISAILGGGAAAALADGVVVGVQNNAANAQTFLQNLASSVAAATDNAVGVALDSSTGLVYIDVNSDGVIDSVIEMTGVTNLTAAAFELV